MYLLLWAQILHSATVIRDSKRRAFDILRANMHFQVTHHNIIPKVLKLNLDHC